MVSEKLRRLFEALSQVGAKLFFNDRMLYEIAAHSAAERWPSAQAYEARIRERLGQIVREGRACGEFERKTPLDETVQAIYLVVEPYANPLLLQYNLDRVQDAPRELSAPALRSLAP